MPPPAKGVAQARGQKRGLAVAAGGDGVSGRVRGGVHTHTYTSACGGIGPVDFEHRAFARIL
jgi:hypothetical protein